MKFKIKKIMQFSANGLKKNYAKIDLNWVQVPFFIQVYIKTWFEKSEYDGKYPDNFKIDIQVL